MKPAIYVLLAVFFAGIPSRAFAICKLAGISSSVASCKASAHQEGYPSIIWTARQDYGVNCYYCDKIASADDGAGTEGLAEPALE